MESFRFDIEYCPRCAQKHIFLLINKFHVNCLSFTHWAKCPTHGEPLLVKVLKMPRPIFGKVRQKAYDAAAMAQYAAQTTSDAAKQNMFSITQALLLLLGDATEAIEEVMDGVEVEGTIDLAGKLIPVKINLKLNFREKENKE